MPLWPTPNNTSQPWIPGTTEPEKIPRQWRIFETLDDLNDAVSIERDNLAMGAPIWATGEPLKVTSEPAASYRYWHIDTLAATPRERADASHARGLVIGGVSTELRGDDNDVLFYTSQSSANPSASIGKRGDIILNEYSGTLYRRAESSWLSMSNKGPVWIPQALLGGAVPDQSQLFSEYMTDKGAHYSDHYAFGTGATTDAGAANRVAITGANLGTHYNHLQDYTGATTINSELQAYVPLGGNTHIIGTDSLELWARLQPGQEWNADYWHQSEPTQTFGINVSVPWSRLPTAIQTAAMSWRVGQLMSLQYLGLYRISEIEHGVSLRIVAVAGSQASGNSYTANTHATLPMDTAVVTGVAGATLSFDPATLSSTIQPGFRVGRVGSAYSLEQFGDVFINSINHAAGTVTLNQAMSAANGTRIVFYPRVSAGQVWSKKGWSITNPDCFFAVEFDYTLFPGLSPSAETRGASNATMLASMFAANPDVPLGAFPALWAYSKDNGIPTGHGPSEIDFMEGFISTTGGLREYSAGSIGPGVGSKLYRKANGGYTVNSGGRVMLPYSIAGRHKLGVVYVRNPDVNRPCLYTYVDDILIQIQEFTWQALNNEIQIGMNMAFGSIQPGFASNLMFPMRTTNFQRACMKVHNMKVWHRPGA